jgi:hypothetical protein
MMKTKYFFKCKGCGRTITVSVDKVERPGLFIIHCPNAVKCGSSGRYKPSEALQIKTMRIQPTRRILIRSNL